MPITARWKNGWPATMRCPVLPSVGSIKALRQFAKAYGAKEPFAGFGDPLVGEADGVSRGKRAKVDIATVFRGSKVRGAGR